MWGESFEPQAQVLNSRTMATQFAKEVECHFVSWDLPPGMELRKSPRDRQCSQQWCWTTRSIILQTINPSVFTREFIGYLKRGRCTYMTVASKPVFHCVITTIVECGLRMHNLFHALPISLSIIKLLEHTCSSLEQQVSLGYQPGREYASIWTRL